jgi:hypothetical protein
VFNYLSLLRCLVMTASCSMKMMGGIVVPKYVIELTTWAERVTCKLRKVLGSAVSQSAVARCPVHPPNLVKHHVVCTTP